MFATGKWLREMSQKPQLAGTDLMTLWTGEVLMNHASASDPLCVTSSPILVMQGGAGAFTEAFFCTGAIFFQGEEASEVQIVSSPHRVLARYMISPGEAVD